MKEQYLLLNYDETKRVPISIAKLDQKIQKELRRLSGVTGLSIKGLSTEYVRNSKEEGLACFNFRLPYRIIFNLDRLEESKISPRQLMEVTQHEFAHYVQQLLYGINMKIEEGHGPDFSKACKKVGCSDSRCITITANRLFNL